MLSAMEAVIAHDAAVSTTNTGFPPAVVYVVDDNLDMRKSVHVLLATVGISSWSFSGAADFLDQLDTLRAAPILLDLRMPGIDGLQAIRELTKRRCDWPVIVLTAHGDIAVAVQAMKLGAIDFLEKPFEFDALDLALRHAFDSLVASAGARCAVSAAQARFKLLTAREAEVVEALLRGLPNKNIAADLGLSIRTVEMHRAHALDKLGARNTVEVVALAARAQWTSRPASPALA